MTATSWIDDLERQMFPEDTDSGWATPGQLATALEPNTVQTPALDLIDQALMETAATPDGRLIIVMPPQEGKALALDTPIATPTGWTTMGALRVGDRVFDGHGEPCRVTWTSPTWTDRPCYEVTTGDGERIVADAAHEWVARLTRQGPERIVETTLLAKTRGKNAQITGPADLNLPDAELPLDPYVLGAWLGDGHTRAAMLTCADIEIVERIRDAGIPCRKGRAPYSWTLAPEGGGSQCSPIRRVLTGLGVWGNKHIPTAYLRGSAKQRLALLQGMIDTDGYVMPKGQIEFCSTRRVLAEGVRELAYSLGAKAVLTEGRATIDGRDCGPKYRVRFYLADAAHLTRKAERCKDSSVARVRYVTAAPTASVPTRCIEVDSPDHTFLAGRTMLPTHNSQRASRRFPTLMLQRNPNLRIAIASYEQNVARRFGRMVRDDIINNPTDLGLTVRRDLSGQAEWQLAGYEGGMFAVGIGGGLTSRPVDMLIIDDPIKDQEQAESKVYRDRVWGWWTTVAETRLAPGAAVVLILTRWHHDDLAGRLLAGEDAAKWRVLHIPAEADHDPAKGDTDPLGRAPGEFMESARGRTDEQWRAKKTAVGSRAWAALYQGRPTALTGGMFPRDRWQFYDTPLWIVRDDGSRVVPTFDDMLASWDMTFKDTKGTDLVVGQVWMRRGADAFLLDQVRGRWDFVRTCQEFRLFAARWPQALLKLVEDKANGPAVISQLQHIVPGIVPEEPQGSKTARAAAITPLHEAGNVWIPAPELEADGEHQPFAWVGEFIEEHAGFPFGAHDDIVDSASQALNRLVLQPLIDGAIVEDSDLDDELDDFSITTSF